MLKSSKPHPLYIFRYIQSDLPIRICFSPDLIMIANILRVKPQFIRKSDRYRTGICIARFS
jgi:hypothetical protein